MTWMNQNHEKGFTSSNAECMIKNQEQNIEIATEYIYLGQKRTLQEPTQTPEINRSSFPATS